MARKEKGKEKRGSGTLRGKVRRSAVPFNRGILPEAFPSVPQRVKKASQSLPPADCNPFLTVSGTANFAVPENVYSAVSAAAASQVTGLPTAAMAK